MKMRLSAILVATIPVFHGFTQVHSYPFFRSPRNPFNEGATRLLDYKPDISLKALPVADEVNSTRGVATQILARVEKVLKGELTGSIKAVVDVSVNHCKHVAVSTLSAALRTVLMAAPSPLQPSKTKRQTVNGNCNNVGNSDTSCNTGTAGSSGGGSSKSLTIGLGLGIGIPGAIAAVVAIWWSFYQCREMRRKRRERKQREQPAVNQQPNSQSAYQPPQAPQPSFYSPRRTQASELYS